MDIQLCTCFDVKAPVPVSEATKASRALQPLRREHMTHFVPEGAKGEVDKFKAFEQFPIGWTDQHIFVDWDEDDDLDVIKMTTEGLDLFEQGDPGYFVKKEPSPFKDAYKNNFFCLPEVGDINGDGKLDMLLADRFGVRYYENIARLEEKTGKETATG
eukprot:s37_g6.t1